MLTPQHQDQLEKGSAIHQSLITQRGYRSLTGAEGFATLKGLGFSTEQARTCPGLLLPLWSVDGTQAVWCDKHGDSVPLTTFRPDMPRLDSRGKAHKYELPAGSTTLLDCPPACTALLSNATLPLWITEGQKKADALASKGACAIALLGVWNWRGTNEHHGSVVLRDWEHIALRGREVRIAYDSDVLDKRGVKQALTRLSQWLSGRGAIVHVVQFPAPDHGAKIGIDDFLAQGHTIDDVTGLLRSAETFGEKISGTPKVVLPAEFAALGLHLTARGEPIEDLFNYMQLLGAHAHWANRLSFNTLRNTPCLDGTPITDALLGQISYWCGQSAKMTNKSFAMLKHALITVTNALPFDPLREFLEALPTWDRTPRLDHWLVEWCDTVEETAYVQWVGRMCIVQMMARAMTPGCLARYVVILQGDENTGKSQLVLQLGTPWSATFDMSLDSKEAHIAVQGLWVAELAELDTLSKSQESRIKSFISQQADHYVPKYANFPIVCPRRTVFIGTTNEAQYLPGQSGNTRFLPVKTGTIDVKRCVAERDQLFAEAVLWYQDHVYDWWEQEAGIAAVVAEEVEKRRLSSVYEDDLRLWLHGRSETTWAEIAEHFLNETDRVQWKDRSLQMQIGVALRACGWERQVIKDGAKSRRVWRAAHH